MKKKRYSVNGKIYMIPENESASFLSEFPDAVEVSHYEVAGKKYNVPLQEADAFETDFGLKKKDGINGSSTGTTVTSPSTLSASALAETGRPESELLDTTFAEERLGKSFLDRDIDSKYDVSLRNPAIFKSENRFSLRNVYDDKKQQQYNQERELVKTDTKKDVVALAKYNQERLVEIDTDIAELKRKQGSLVQGAYGGATYIGDIKTHNKLEDDITELNVYKAQLKGSVAREAINKILPKYLDVKEFNAHAIGRELIKVSDPELDYQYETTEKNGGALPPIQNAAMERLGLDVAKDFLSQQPDSEQKRHVQDFVNGLEADFEERNPEVVAQRVREKLGATIYKEGGIGSGGLFGYGSGKLLDAVNKTDLTPVEKKSALEYVLPMEQKLFGTNIPGSGSFRSALNAIEGASVRTGNSIMGLLGKRGDPERAYENLNEEVGGSRYRAAGENPKNLAELDYLKAKEQSEGGLTKEETLHKTNLEKYTDIRTGLSRFMDGTGDLTGQVFQIVMLTKGIGGIGGAATALGRTGGIMGGAQSSAIGSVLSNETVGLVVSGMLNSYDSYKSQALQIMPGDKNAANRDAYAKTMSVIEGLTEKIFNDTKVLKAFMGSGVAPAIADITSKLINRELTQAAAQRELRSSLKKYLVPFGKELGKSTNQEGIEEAAVVAADHIAQAAFGGVPFDIAATGKEALQTYLTTAMYSGVVSGMAAHGAYKENRTQNAFVKSAIVDMARSPAAYLKSAEDLKINGTITNEQYNEKVKLIKEANNYLKEMPSSRPVAGEDKQFDYPEVSSYLVHRLNEGILAEKVKGTADPIYKEKLEGQLKRSEGIRKGIYEGTIAVTPNIVEVTDDKKKAEELGIANADELEPDELIGTGFEKPERTIVKEFFDNDLLPAGSERLLTNEKGEFDETKEQEYLKFVSEQAQGGREDAMISLGYPQQLIDAAKEAFPVAENKKSETEAGATELRSGEVPAVSEEPAVAEPEKKQGRFGSVKKFFAPAEETPPADQPTGTTEESGTGSAVIGKVTPKKPPAEPEPALPIKENIEKRRQRAISNGGFLGNDGLYHIDYIDPQERTGTQIHGDNKEDAIIKLNAKYDAEIAAITPAESKPALPIKDKKEETPAATISEEAIVTMMKPLRKELRNGNVEIQTVDPKTKETKMESMRAKNAHSSLVRQIKMLDLLKKCL